MYVRFMASGTNFTGRFATALGETLASRERTDTELRRAGLTPTSKPGGGKGAVHFEADHCVHAVLSAVAARANDAPGNVRLLDGLRYGGSVPKGAPAPEGDHLGFALVSHLNRLAVPLSRTGRLDDAELAWARSWELTLCLDPAFAQIKANDGNGLVAHFFHAGDIGRAVPMKKLTVLSGDVLLAVAGLLAHTYVQNNALAAVQFLDATKPPATTTEHKEAGNILADAPAVCVGQTRSSESSDVHQAAEFFFT